MCELKLISGKHFEEKEVRYDLTLDDINSYTNACIKAADIIKKESPDVYICPLRGAYPPTRIILPLLEGWRGNVEYVPTSEFLENKEEIVHSALEKILSKATKKFKILTVDTVITGSSIRRYKNLLKGALPDLAVKHYIDFLDNVIIKLWQDRKFGIRPHSFERQVKDKKIRFTDYNIGLNKLICEDDPILLGIDYAFNFKGGKKSEFILYVNGKNPIYIKDRQLKITEHPPSESQPTSDVFVNIIKNNIDKIKQLSNTS